VRGRIRQLKPDVFLDEELWSLIEAHPDLHLLQAFEGLWCQADREGRFEWRPAMLKTQILPYWGGDFACSLEALRGAGLIRKYEVQGRVYGEVRSFLRHQRPNNREPVSVIPPPLEQTQVALEHAEAGLLEHAKDGCAAPLEPAGLSPARVPTPTPTPRSGSGSRVASPDPQSDPRALIARTYSLPTQVPSPEYLDAALMAGVSREQAASTWTHYFGEGLPARGVERLIPWLVQRAKERANSLARVERRKGEPPPAAKLPGRPYAEVMAEWAAAESGPQPVRAARQRAAP
jgi:hypothetical protein